MKTQGGAKIKKRRRRMRRRPKDVTERLYELKLRSDRESHARERRIRRTLRGRARVRALKKERSIRHWDYIGLDNDFTFRRMLYMYSRARALHSAGTALRVMEHDRVRFALMTKRFSAEDETLVVRTYKKFARDIASLEKLKRKYDAGYYESPFWAAPRPPDFLNTLYSKKARTDEFAVQFQGWRTPGLRLRRDQSAERRSAPL